MLSLPRILVVNSSDSFGGSEKVLWNTLAPWCNSLQQEKCKLMLPGKGRFSSISGEMCIPTGFFNMGSALENAGDSPVRDIKILKVLMRLFLGLPGLVGALRQIWFHSKMHCPHLVVANGFKAQILCALAIRGKFPLVWYFQDFVSNRKIVRKILPLLYNPRIKVIADSSAVSDDLMKVLARTKPTVWKNTVDTKIFKPAESLPEPNVDHTSRPIRVGLVATFARWKGHETFFRAAKKILETFEKPIHFVVVGGPLYRANESQWSQSELESMAETVGIRKHIDFLGFHEDIVGIYQDLDIVVHASTAPEPFGQVIIEAMACGKPVIVAAHGGAAEIGTPGEDLLHHVPGDCESLAQGIALLLNNFDLRKKMGLRSRNTAIQLFDIGQVDSRWSALLAEMEIAC